MRTVLTPAAVAAAVVSILGTLTLGTLGWALMGLIGTLWDLAFCALGAFLSTLLVYRMTNTRFWRNLLAATIITFATFASISIGHAASQVFERHVAVDFEPIGKFIWATVATSWWLIPICAGILTLVRRRPA